MPFEARFRAAAVRYASVRAGLGGGGAHGRARTVRAGAACWPSAGAVRWPFYLKRILFDQ